MNAVALFLFLHEEVFTKGVLHNFRATAVAQKAEVPVG